MHKLVFPAMQFSFMHSLTLSGHSLTAFTDTVEKIQFQFGPFLEMIIVILLASLTITVSTVPVRRLIF